MGLRIHMDPRPLKLYGYISQEIVARIHHELKIAINISVVNHTAPNRLKMLFVMQFYFRSKVSIHLGEVL